MDDAKLVAASAIALAVTLFAIFSMRPLAKRLGLVDRPDARKRHRGQVPLVGGLCFFLGTIMGLAYLGYIDHLVASLLVPGTLIVMTGVVDDMRALSVRSRLVIQGCTAFIVIAATGIFVDSGGYILGGRELYFGLLGLPITIIAVIGLMNAFNMLDGIDGLAAGLAMVSIAAILVFADAGWPTLGIVLLLQVLFAALVPYLCVNLGWPDGRKIFMGDAGSTLIGFLLAWSLIFLSHRGIARLSPVDALWCVALPVMDTLAVMLRRVRKGVSPFTPDRQHLHHLLLAAGCPPRAALLAILAASGLLALLGYGLRGVSETVSFGCFAGLLALYLLRFDRVPQWLRARLPASSSKSPSTAAAPAAAIAIAGDPAPEAIRALCVLTAADDAAQIAPIARQLARDGRFRAQVCVAGCGAAERTLALFGLDVDVRLDIREAADDPTDAASQALDGMKHVIENFRPDVVLVPGRASTAAAATAVAAFYQQIPVACVEPAATESTPGPGDANRKITRTLASLHFTPNEAIGRELVAAGVPLERILVTGNTTAGTLHAAVQRTGEDAATDRELGRSCRFLREGSPLLLVTDCEGSDYGFEPLCRALRRVAMRRHDVDVVCLASHAPDSMGRGELLRSCPNINILTGADYLTVAWLMARARLIVVASPEFASEASVLGKPVLHVQAEVPIPALDLGNVRRIGVHEQTIAGDVLRLLGDGRVYDALCRAPDHRSDSDACLRIVDALASIRAGAPVTAVPPPLLDVVCRPVEDLRQAS